MADADRRSIWSRLPRLAGDRRPRAPSGRAVRQVLAGPKTGLLAATGLLFLWLSVGTIGYMLIEGWGFLDAVFMTTITLSTVGYGEVHPLTPAGRIFSILLMGAGLGTVLYAFTRIGQLVIEGELLDIMGMRRMRQQIDNLEGHYIVCGYGRTGKPVVDGLVDEDKDVCVVELDPDLAPELRDAGVLFVIGDATEEETLLDAGLERAEGIMGLLPSDPDNVYLAITAQGVNPTAKVIVRASDEQAEMKMRRVGADEVVSPNKMAGERVLQAALRPTVVEFMELVTHRQHLHLNLEEVKVSEGSILAGETLGDAELRRRAGAIIVAIKRATGEMVFNPKPADMIHAGDTLIALGEREDLQDLAAICR